MTFHFKVRKGLYPDLFIDFRTSCLKKHRYRHQDYFCSMLLTKDTKNYEHFLLESSGGSRGEGAQEAMAPQTMDNFFSHSCSNTNH